MVAQQTYRYGGCSGGSSRRKRKSQAPGRGGNVTSYHSGAGLLPTPSTTSQPQPPHSPNCSSETRHLFVAATPIPIPKTTRGYENDLSFHELSYPERWAGPAYSISPPPSSVPIPKFSSRSTMPTRTVSLELPVIAKEGVYIQPLAKSAPNSPRKSRPEKHLFGTADNNATEALRRILNLDICDE